MKASESAEATGRTMEEKIQEFEAVLLRLKYHPHYVTDVICCIRKMYMFGEPTRQSVEDYANSLTRARGNAYRRAVSIFKKWCITGKDPKRRKHSEIDIDAFDYDMDKKESKEKAYIYRDSHSLMYGGQQ